MSIVLNDNLKIEAPKLIDARFGPHANLGAALAFITPALREMGLIFFVKDGSNLLEYWWPTTDLSDGGIALRSYQPLDADLTAIANIIDGGTGFLKKTAPNTWSLDSTVVTASTAAGGELEGFYPNPTLKNVSVINKVLSGFNTVGGGTIVDGDSILVAFGKVQNQLNALYGGMQFINFWDASTNTPTIPTAALGNKGNYYIVQVAGITNIGGITDWRVGDWVVSNGSVWSKIDNTDAVISVNGYTSAVTLTTSDIAEGTNLYYTDLRVKTYADTLYSVLGHTHTFASLTSKPTTISGYGITDAYIKSEIDNFFNGVVGISGYNKTNWDLAYGWGNHALAGYVKGTGVAQRVPYFSATDTITSTSRFIWNTSLNALIVNQGIAGTVGATLSGAFDGGSLQVWNGHELAVMGSNVGNSGDVATMIMKSNKGISTANGYIEIQGYYAGGANNAPIIMQRQGGVVIIGNIAAGADATSLLQVNGPIRQTSVTSALLKASATGILQAAVAGTDYLVSADLSNYYTQTQIQNFFSGASAMTGYNKVNWDAVYAWYQSGPLTGLITAAHQYYIGTTLNALNRASGAQTLTGVSIDGNAGTASTWQTARTLTIGSTGKSVSGGADVSWSLAEIGAQAAYANLTTIGALANANGFLRQNGAGVFSYDTSTYYLASNPNGYTTNTGTVTSVSGTGTVSGLTLSGTVTSSGSLTLGGTLALTAANVNAVGAITNNTSGTAASLSAVLSSTLGGAGSVSGILKANGTGTVSAAVAGTDYVAGSSLSGTTNYIPKFTSSTAIGNSQVFDNGTNVLIGTISAGSSITSTRLGVLASSAAAAIGIYGRALDNEQRIDFFNNDASARIMGITAGNTEANIFVNSNIPLIFSTNNTERMRISSGGNTLIKTTTDNGTDALQVAGSGLFSGALTGGQAKFSSTTAHEFRYATTGNTYLKIAPEAANGDVVLQYAANSGAAPNFRIKNDAGTTNLLITDAGAITASSSVTANTNTTIGNTNPIYNGNSGTSLLMLSSNASWLELATSSTTDGNGGIITFNNTNIAGADKRFAAIAGLRDGANNSGALSFSTWNAGSAAERLRIAPNGAITASSSVTATGLTLDRTATGSNYLNIKALNSASNDIAVYYGDGTNNVYSGMMRGTAGSSDAAFHVYTGSSIKLTIASTGAATFSSSVTASSLIKSGGTSSQFLKADGSVDGNTYLTTSGVAAQVTINYNNDTNSTYQMLWGSGNSVYGTGGIYCNPSTDVLYASSFNGNWNGLTYSNSAGANTIVQRDSNGYIFNSYFNTSSGGAERNATGMGYFAGFNSSDYYIRSYTPTAARIAMGLATTDNVTFNRVTGTNGGQDSDLTLKNVVGTGSLLNIADQIEVIRYFWKDPAKGTTMKFGYGAQHIDPLIPQAVYTTEAGTLAVDYTQVHTVLIDENTRRIRALEARVKQLESQLNLN